MNYPFRCEECGRFFSVDDPDAISYVPYGSYGDEREPDEEYICGKCWNKRSIMEKEIVKDIAYSGIHPFHKEGQL